METFYQRLKPLVLPRVQIFQSDFRKHDRAVLTRLWSKHRTDAKFILAVRDSGTNLYDYTEPGEFSESEIKERIPILKLWMLRENEVFYHCYNGEITEISKTEAEKIIESNPRGKLYG